MVLHKYLSKGALELVCVSYLEVADSDTDKRFFGNLDTDTRFLRISDTDSDMDSDILRTRVSSYLWYILLHKIL